MIYSLLQITNRIHKVMLTFRICRLAEQDVSLSHFIETEIIYKIYEIQIYILLITGYILYCIKPQQFQYSFSVVLNEIYFDFEKSKSYTDLSLRVKKRIHEFDFENIKLLHRDQFKSKRIHRSNSYKFNQTVVISNYFFHKIKRTPYDSTGK